MNLQFPARDIAAMFALLFGIHFFSLLALSYFLFGGQRPSRDPENEG